MLLQKEIDSFYNTVITANLHILKKGLAIYFSLNFALLIDFK